MKPLFALGCTLLTLLAIFGAGYAVVYAINLVASTVVASPILFVGLLFVLVLAANIYAIYRGER